RSAQRSVSQIMMGRYQFLPLPVQLTIFGTNQNQLQPTQLLDRALKLRRHVQLRPSKAHPAKAHTAARRWQIDQSTLGPPPPCYSTAHRLALAVLGAPVQPVADP